MFYLSLGDNTILLCLEHFQSSITSSLSRDYVRDFPNSDDTPPSQKFCLKNPKNHHFKSPESGPTGGFSAGIYLSTLHFDAPNHTLHVEDHNS